MSGNHVFRRNPAELHRTLQVDELAVRRSQASSTLRIIEFPKDFQGFWKTVHQVFSGLANAALARVFFVARLQCMASQSFALGMLYE